MNNNNINERLEKAVTKSNKFSKIIEKKQRKLAKIQREIEILEQKQKKVKESIDVYYHFSYFGHMDNATQIDAINTYHKEILKNRENGSKQNIT